MEKFMRLPTIEEYGKEKIPERISYFLEYTKKYAKKKMKSKTDKNLYVPLLEGKQRKGDIPDSLRENYFEYKDYKKFKDKNEQIQVQLEKIKMNEYAKNHFKAALSKYEEFLEFLSNKNEGNIEEHAINEKSKSFPLNQILYGPPGTGKTYNTIPKALDICGVEIVKEESESEKEFRKKLKIKFEELCKEGQIVFITFHQSMSYEDFIEGIKPKLNENQDENSKISYEIKPGIFKKICTDAEKDLDNSYILIIDEINRGNVSQIFGELITLIEEDKRLGGDEELSVRLPYSKEEFRVPDNLYIIGTMNTSDRSVEALDTALRRRFSFIEMMTEPELLNSNMQGIDLQQLLKTINERIEKLLDREHQIGHSYFLNIKDLEDLKQVFKDKIIPLLQEYFFGDYGKIGLVLGKEFVEKISEPKFANFDYDIEDKDVYRLKISDNFKSIYE